MGVFDKLSKLIFVEEDKPKGKWTDIFFVEENEGVDDKKTKKSLSSLFFKEVEDESAEEVKSTFVGADESSSVLNDILSKVERRESELKNLSDFFRVINPKEFPDCTSEYEAYIELLRKLNGIKELIATNDGSAMSSMNNYKIENDFKKFEADYQASIKAIKSLCYLSELSTLNSEMIEMFSENFTSKTEHRIGQLEDYITLISKKNGEFDKKYSARLYKELIEAEYRLTILKLMDEIKDGNAPRRNPFYTFSQDKKKIFETYLSDDIRNSSAKYNSVADNKDKYVRYGFVAEEEFTALDRDAEGISDRVNRFTIDDFVLDELFENGEGYETLKSFLSFKLRLNFIDSKTAAVDERVFNDTYKKSIDSRIGSQVKRGTASRRVTLDESHQSEIRNQVNRSRGTNGKSSNRRRGYPSLDDE